MRSWSRDTSLRGALATKQSADVLHNEIATPHFIRLAMTPLGGLFLTRTTCYKTFLVFPIMVNNLIPKERIENKIYLLRGQKVMLDENLAELYQVPTKRLNECVKRNIKRFPKDFMFQLTGKEIKILRSQFVTSRYGGRRYIPYVFTEQGVVMLSSVLNSERAIQVNIQIMRTFTRLRRIISSHRQLANKLKQLGKKIDKHDDEIQTIFEAINRLVSIEQKPKRKIGFYVE